MRKVLCTVFALFVCAPSVAHAQGPINVSLTLRYAPNAPRILRYEPGSTKEQPVVMWTIQAGGPVVIYDPEYGERLFGTPIKNGFQDSLLHSEMRVIRTTMRFVRKVGSGDVQFTTKTDIYGGQERALLAGMYLRF
ncbi:hypothetical protein A3E65_01905 [Candidatus Kaiserbacteria bacterium RIFCSPHIGHO2_12_FULL_56_13]|uniref:Uncharacterized protein n=2 Tax=Candidatus Kaiseribacteriota TaxID=1752734 RepID=A0A1F6E2N7_9BACT|nr:MAG: hypothetical protein A3C95_01255 [Candidatus Kaiserbacteria bacterium RIFCSPHIGHO2_02_FULL_56_30]OGG72249.1 MAG: hypothetical protein A3E65_01905 [Candidatus Kaiserbacteria bacterium RIFCSPHIGHO2_12_FULL_56_13]